MRFIGAVALALVMLWVPVDASGQSGQEVTITAVEMRFISATPYVTFESRNYTSRTIVVWRGNLQVRNPFGDVIWEGELIFGEATDLPPTGMSRKEQRLNPSSISPGFDFRDYQVKDMIFRWAVQVAYAP